MTYPSEEMIRRIQVLVDDYDDEKLDEDYDPTPNYLWDDTGGEPPLTQEEIIRINEEREAAWLLDVAQRGRRGI